MVEAQARGLRVPEDLAVCGFGDADFAAHTQPSLTTVHVDGAAIGRLAAQLIVERCRGQAVARAWWTWASASSSGSRPSAGNV